MRPLNLCGAGRATYARFSSDGFLQADTLMLISIFNEFDLGGRYAGLGFC